MSWRGIGHFLGSDWNPAVAVGHLLGGTANQLFGKKPIEYYNYSPEDRIKRLQDWYNQQVNPLYQQFQNQWGNKTGVGYQVNAPQAYAPSASEAGHYGQTAMDLAARSAAIQSANAYQQMDQQMSPAARAAALAQISQQSASGVGTAGVQGFQSGLDTLSRFGLSNQDANLRASMANQGSYDSARQLAASMTGQQAGMLEGIPGQVYNTYDQIMANQYPRGGDAVNPTLQSGLSSATNIIGMGLGTPSSAQSYYNEWKKKQPQYNPYAPMWG
jgi:hypothetical protein